MPHIIRTIEDAKALEGERSPLICEFSVEAAFQVNEPLLEEVGRLLQREDQGDGHQVEDSSTSTW